MGRSIMEDPDFDQIVKLKVLPIPGENLHLLAMMADGDMTAPLGNLVDFLTTGIEPDKQQYFQLVLPDGAIIDHNDARDLVSRAEFRAWVASKH